MHHEVFNEAKIYSYQQTLLETETLPEERAGTGIHMHNIFSRDHNPVKFLIDLYSSSLKVSKHNGKIFYQNARAVGFKLFPEHWTASRWLTLEVHSENHHPSFTP
jgi:hypothetical protein